MKTKFKKIIALVIIVIGIALIIYPFMVKNVTSSRIKTSIDNFIGITKELEFLDNSENKEIVDEFENVESNYNKREYTKIEKNSSSNKYSGKTTRVYSSENAEDDIIVEENAISEMKNNLLEDLYNEMKEYNKKLNEEGQNIVDAFSYETPSFDLTKYGLNENIIGIIKIPNINLELPIYLGATAENLNKGATHLSQTSIPLGEENSNVVIAAHRSLFKNEFFKNIDKLNIGDKVIIQTLWDELTYEVTTKNVISPSDSSKILIQKDEDLVTLVTCHPYGKTSERYIVYCKRK